VRDNAQITQILDGINDGDADAMGRLAGIVYDELRHLADLHLQRERSGHTLQPTALVHEAFLRVLGSSDVHWHGRAHFFRTAAEAMRRILVDYARSRNAQKRGGGQQRVELNESIDGSAEASEVVLAVHDALARLAEIDAEKARIVEMRFFGGLAVGEVAEALDVSDRTVERHWKTARAWLAREISRIE
jgi:RNA polymerase sigma factor (TIGR02999 family)